VNIVKQDGKKIISVLGAPHSGTTVVNNILNSMVNAFCISEPHWVINRNLKKLKFDKVGDIKFTSQNDFMKGVIEKLQNSDYDFGGVKETYRSAEPRMQRPYKNILGMSDVIIFVYRDPIALYNSQKNIRPVRDKATNLKSIAGLIKNFNSQYNLALQYKDKAVNIVLEDLCSAGNANAIKYLNTVLAGKAVIEGKFMLHKTNFIFGNPKANRSERLLPANMNKSLVTPGEIKQLRKVYPKYRSLRVTL